MFSSLTLLVFERERREGEGGREGGRKNGQRSTKRERGVMWKEGMREKGEGAREKGEGMREKGEGMKEKGEGMRKKGEEEVTTTEHNSVFLTPALSAVQQLSPCETSPPLGSCVETAPSKTGAGRLERGETLCLQPEWREGAEDVIKKECRKSGLYTDGWRGRRNLERRDYCCTSLASSFSCCDSVLSVSASFRSAELIRSNWSTLRASLTLCIYMYQAYTIMYIMYMSIHQI